MSLRTACSMGDLSARLPTILHQPPSPPPCQSDDDNDDNDDDDSDDDFHFDFPQPPSITPALRRMRSSPWYLQHLEVIPKPERRHSISPLIQLPQPQPYTHLSCPSRHEVVGETSRPKEVLSETCQLLKSTPHREPFLPRRLDRLPPPAPAPSIPLPRLPRIIRKVASMRSEPKQDSMEPLISESRRPVPKIRSLKFLSGSMGLGNSTTQLLNPAERKRSWSLSRPTSFQNPKDAPPAGSSYTSTSDRSNSAARGLAPLDYASPVVYSNPCLIGNTFDPQTGATVGSEGRFDLSRGITSLAPPFTHRATKSNSSTFHRYSYTRCAEGTTDKSGSSVSHDRPVGSHQSSRSFYHVSGDNMRGNASSAALLQGAKSFINITPERRKSRSRKSASGSHSSFANESGSVGAVMKEKGEKIKKLFARASDGVVGWGRQLARRSAKPVAAGSTSASLAPLTEVRS